MKELKRILSENKLTIRELSKKIGVSERMIKYYLSGKYPVPKKVTLALQTI